MSEDQEFRNPSLKRGSGGMVWWQCPRCNGQDVFLGKRPGGSVSSIPEVGDTGNFMAVQKQFMVDTWVCRPCGEIATQFWRKLTDSETEAIKVLNKETEGAWSVLAVYVLIFFGFIGIMLWLVIDIFSP
jgi:hypothetical protein